MKYYIIAGEASGDLHGSNLIKELHHCDARANIRCWGGDKMEAAGAQLVKHYRQLAFMGFAEVLKNLPTILKNLAFCKKDILQFEPDVLVLIDYPGFNLRIAKWARQQGIKVAWYISPQVWAWKESRVKAIKRDIDKMFVILPFEKAFYQKWQYDVEYVGHPLVKVIDGYTPEVELKQDKSIIALLPGSRKQEITIKLPLMLAASVNFPGYQFMVAKAPGIEDAFYTSMLAAYPHVKTVTGQTYSLLYSATAALVTSGTATLETALFGVPQVVCYKGSAISYQVAKRLIKIKYISLVNLIMDKPVVTELIQDALTAANITTELGCILNQPEKALQIKKDYAALRQLLSQGGDASAATAAGIYQLACNNSCT
ncbi:MAG TPA: lipid-A-disaccharide synthase [Ferruginibacter sp.]|nr:lipid-A-disaccharide synthase [Ferruginibacter sp.]HMP21300.1 lipid-A-disaccharide synthase [Ferruginibacter sp.]